MVARRALRFASGAPLLPAGGFTTGPFSFDLEPRISRELRSSRLSSLLRPSLAAHLHVRRCGVRRSRRSTGPARPPRWCAADHSSPWAV